MAKLIGQNNPFAAHAGETFACPSGKGSFQIEGNEETVEKSFSAGYGWQTDELPAFECPVCRKYHTIRRTDDGSGNGRDPHYYVDTAKN